MFNYSFWADEAYIAGKAMQWVTGMEPLSAVFNALGITYQRLQLVIVGAFFKIFGISELIARLPSFIAFMIGVIAIFFLARKLSNMYGGILSAFLYAFSHLNLAYATQAKPYSALETIALLVILIIVSLEKEQKKSHTLLYHASILGLLCIASFLHTIGVFLWVLYFVFLLQTFKRFNVQTILVIGLSLFLIFLVALPYLSIKLFPYNHLYQLVKLFSYKYSIISICAALGFIWSFNKKRMISLVMLTYLFVVLLLAAFQHYIFNIRYVLSLFGIIFLYFGIFWAKVGERYKFKLGGRAVIPIVVIILLYGTGYKIVRWPQAYYNPNIDKYGDVQIANYKDFYAELKLRFPQYNQLFVVNDLFDMEPWYFGRYSNAYFMKLTTKPYKHHAANAFVYGSLDDFKMLMKANPQGLLIVEDWQSLLPDDVKEYAKKNLRLEFRVESLKEAPDDPWPLALYSWGLNEVTTLKRSNVQTKP